MRAVSATATAAAAVGLIACDLREDEGEVEDEGEDEGKGERESEGKREGEGEREDEGSGV